MPTNTSGRNGWIDAPDTKGLALRVTVYLIATGFIVYGSLTPLQLACVAAAWFPHWWKQRRAKLVPCVMALDAHVLRVRQDLKVMVY
jgi:hypothetical protein